MNNLEIIGFGFGIAGVWLTIRKHIACFPVGLVNVSITAWLVWQQQLYADVLQQMVYFVLLIYGWYAWTTGKKDTEISVSRLNLSAFLYLGVLILVVSVIMGYLLKTMTTASFPYFDSTGTLICFTAQWLVARRKIENWLLWILANGMYIIIYYLKDLPWYSLLSAIYLVMAILGWLHWKKLLHASK